MRPINPQAVGGGGLEVFNLARHALLGALL